MLALLLGAGLSLQAGAQSGAGVKALAELSLEDLMRVEVVSAGREAERLADVAAPVFVITRDDIARTGVRSLPEVLRLAPGVDVARLSAGRWAVGVRGDTGRFSNKLQVLVDGRSIYSPLFSGVLWETHQVPLGEIERIEIIRGPAGAVWGANAVNGVINIITRPADGGGRAARIEAVDDGSLRLGLRAGQRLDDDAGGWRAHAQVERQSASEALEGGQAHAPPAPPPPGCAWSAASMRAPGWTCRPRSSSPGSRTPGCARSCVRPTGRRSRPIRTMTAPT